MTAWHTRVRTLYRWSDPAADLETTQELIDCFIFGLSHLVIRGRTLDARPATMTADLEQAASKSATVTCMTTQSGKKPRLA